MRLKTSLNIKNIKNMKNSLRKVILALCICIFIFSLFMIAKKLYAYNHDDTQYQKIREQVNSDDSSDKFARVFSTPQPVEAQLKPDASPTLPYIVDNGNVLELDKNKLLSDYSALKGQNKDLIGWIVMPGFKKSLDYPVMQAEDNDFYLNHDFYRNESQAGSIFMDHRNNSLEVDRHIVLYGHAMKDLSMFGNLKEFPDKPSDHNKNTRIYLDLLNTRLEYEVIATYYENASYDYRQTSFSSNDEFLTYMEKILSKSVYNYKIKLTDKDKILTLSTCNNNLGSEIRSITHARLIRQIIYDGIGNTETTEASMEQSSKEVVSANVYLKQLSLEYGDEGNPEKAVLAPAFESGIKEFASQLPSEVETVRLAIEKADPEAAVEVVLNGQKADMNSLKLVYEENIIIIKIISRDKKYSRTLTVTATRTPTPSPSVLPAASQTLSSRLHLPLRLTFYLRNQRHLKMSNSYDFHNFTQTGDTLKTHISSIL